MYYNKENVERLRQRYPEGTRICLDRMNDDPFPVESGTLDMVDHVDDAGTLHCIFDNGRTLGVIPGVDDFHVIREGSEQTEEEEMNISMWRSVGLIGEPFEIETTSKFDKATLTYVIDKSKLGDTEFDNLLFLWYDEENDNFDELDTILDEENSTVSVETTHFSKYMIVDGKEWYRAWQDIYTKINESKGQHIPNALFDGDSGAQQYNLLGQEKAEWFYNKRKI